jgi:hypothetical protein
MMNRPRPVIFFPILRANKTRLLTWTERVDMLQCNLFGCINWKIYLHLIILFSVLICLCGLPYVVNFAVAYKMLFAVTMQCSVLYFRYQNHIIPLAVWSFIPCIHCLEYIVTYRRVRVTIMTGSSWDDWIYWHFVYNLLITLSYNAIAILHTFSSPLHTH